MGGSDVHLRQHIGVTSIPSGPNEVTAANFTLGAGSSGSLNVNTIPSNQTLGLWDFLFSVYIDVDDPAYRFSVGESLTTPQRNLRVSTWVDWADSSDITNQRTVRIRLENYDVSSHTYYIKFKAYSFSANIVGT